MIVSNNQSFFNDELHQERVARTRGRPIENRWIGLRMDGPRMNLATLAQGQGAIGLGPVRTVADLQDAIETSVARVRDGALCVIDVHVAPEYARAMSSSLMRHISTTS
jgi:hypothetical protein